MSASRSRTWRHIKHGQVDKQNKRRFSGRRSRICSLRSLYANSQKADFFMFPSSPFGNELVQIFSCTVMVVSKYVRNLQRPCRASSKLIFYLPPKLRNSYCLEMKCEDKTNVLMWIIHFMPPALYAETPMLLVIRSERKCRMQKRTYKMIIFPRQAELGRPFTGRTQRNGLDPPWPR